MKTQTRIMVVTVMLLVCFVAGCSTTSDIKIRANPQSDYDEPFIPEIREIATQRERFYYLGKPIDPEEYDRRVSDVVNRQDLAHTTSLPEPQREVVPIFMLRF